MDLGTTSTAGTDRKSFGGGRTAADLNLYNLMFAAMECSYFGRKETIKTGICIDCDQGQFHPQNRVEAERVLSCRLTSVPEYGSIYWRR